MIKEFEGKVVVVMGAGSGIGCSFVFVFVGEGMKFVIVDVMWEILNKVVEEVESLGVEVMSRVVDVSDWE